MDVLFGCARLGQMMNEVTWWPTMKVVFDSAALVSNVLTAIASFIAIYLFATKRRELSKAVSLLLNYAYQTTLAELKEKLERLNEYNASDPDDSAEIRNILHEIAGQIRGNKRFQSTAPKLVRRIEALAAGTNLTEPRKRSMVSELRESLRTIQVHTIEIDARKDHE
jgi:hypothetical protein